MIQTQKENKVEKILENWQALEEVEKICQDQTGDPQAGFHADYFFLGSIGRSIMIPILYRKPTKSGFTNKYYKMQVVAKFCPLTGKPLYTDSVESITKK